MFRNRLNSQKPTDELYASFKQSYPALSSISPVASSSDSAPALATTASSNEALTSTINQNHLEAQHDSKDSALTPRASADQWRFTPSIFDTNFTFGSFANQPHGYYTPTPGGMNTVYHNQTAGDLHTPGMAFHLGTPLSMPMPDASLHPPSTFDMQGFNPQIFQMQPYQNHPQYQAHSTSYPPSMLVHQDSGYAAMDKSPDNDLDVNPVIVTDAHLASAVSLRGEGNMAAPPLPPIEKFRWHITLNAPTAMIRRPDEIPMTYLNKGQAYTISIVDGMPLPQAPRPVKYRTVIRISFEDEQQRQRPSACWQLWKEGRGLAEAHQRGGKLQAVEYVDPHPGAEDDPRRPKLELEKASFDSFSVIWSPPITSNSAECSVAVRFNFLSTDFSHSKGVKGIPVRLCAKTEMLTNLDSCPSNSSEVCYSMVKLFRDHGAERKLANDVAHVKKTIEKLKTQIAQMESGVKDVNKRKRTASMAGKQGGERPGKLLKRKRTWSISSQGSSGRPAAEEDLHQKLATVQDMFTSTRPVSVLYLKGDDQDDPDRFPVSLPGEGQDLSKADLLRRESWDPKRSGDASPSSSSLDSPVPSSRSVPDKSILYRSSGKGSRQLSSEWPMSATLPSTNFSAILEDAVTAPTKIKSMSNSELSGWIEAVDVDPSYVPPAERLVKPIACFYVLIKIAGRMADNEIYRAVYLLQRTVGDLTSSIASKCDVDPSRVQRAVRINSKGLKILVDEELVREIPEGQDMVVEFCEFESSSPVKNEPSNYLISSNAQVVHKPLEMRLTF